MKKQRNKSLLPNVILALASSCFFIWIITSYGGYHLCLKGEMTGMGYSIGVIAFVFAILVSLPLAGVPLLLGKSDAMVDLQSGQWLIARISMVSGVLLLAGMGFCRSLFENGLYYNGKDAASGEDGMFFWKLMMIPCALTGILLIVSLYQEMRLRKIGSDIGSSIILRFKMNRRDVVYLALMELGMLMLTILFYALIASHFGECIIFRGDQPYGIHTPGTMIYICAGVLEDISEVMLFGTPIVTFIALKKDVQKRIMRIAPRFYAAVNGFLLVIMLYYITFYDTDLYNGDYEIIQNCSGNAVTLTELLVVPIGVAALLLILSLHRMWSQSKESE